MNKQKAVNGPKKTGTGSFPPLALILCLGMILLGMGALAVGRFSISFGSVMEILLSRFLGRSSRMDPAIQNVVMLLRLPRILAAMLVGSALALSGSTYQGIFKNPLAAQELLGVFQGSSVGAAAAILFNLGAFSIQMMALIGGLSSVGLALLIARFFKSDSTAILVLAGVIVSGLMRSVLGMLKYIMDSETQLPSIVYWEMGSLADITMAKLGMIAVPMLVSMVVLAAIRWQFNLLSLGDNEAKSLGLNLYAVRGMAVVFSTLLTSCAVCISGTIAWIGLIIPHAGRIFVGPDNVKLVPVVFFMGAIFLILVDTAARSISGFEIPLSILTGLIGAPLCITLIYRQRVGVK
jgi:iron complex transport system permease protein